MYSLPIRLWQELICKCQSMKTTTDLMSLMVFHLNFWDKNRHQFEPIETWSWDLTKQLSGLSLSKHKIWLDFCPSYYLYEIFTRSCLEAKKLPSFFHLKRDVNFVGRKNELIEKKFLFFVKNCLCYFVTVA